LSPGVPEPVAPRPAGPRPVAAERDVQVVQVQFKGLRREYYAAREAVPLVEGEHVIVEADRGRDLGWVHRAAHADQLTCDGGCEHAGDRPVIPPPRRVLRRAAPVDVERLLELRSHEADVRTRTRVLVEKHGLKMKASEAEWQWDRNKLTVYFTADKRVDFRALVRDMAGEFRTRIELRQIGVRDEARRLGGIGRCRRELCCRAWLPEIQPVTLQLAKDQGLSLNPAQISGACGRLMSCLHYEHEAYLQARKRFPREGQTLGTSRGQETVVGWNLFKETVTLKDDHGERRTLPLEELKREARGRPGNPGRAEGTDRR